MTSDEKIAGIKKELNSVIGTLTKNNKLEKYLKRSLKNLKNALAIVDIMRKRDVMFPTDEEIDQTLADILALGAKIEQEQNNAAELTKLAGAVIEIIGKFLK